MIRIDALEKEVLIKIDTKIPVEGKVCIFTWETGDKLFSYLLRRQLNKALDEVISEIRSHAYDKGYKDGHNHKKKETRFNGNIRSDEVTK